MSDPTPGSETGQRAGDLLGDLLAVLLGVTGLLVVLSGRGPGWLWLLLALLAVAGLLLRGWRRDPLRRSPLGRAGALRALPVTGVAVTLAGSGETSAALAATVGTALLIGCLAAEPAVVRASRLRAPVTVGLPGIPSAPATPALDWPALVASLLATAAGLVVAGAGWSPWWWVLVTAVAAVPLAALALSGRATIVFTRRLRRLVPEAVARYAPDFVVYTSRPDDASYQVLMWLPYLERAGLRFLVVARNPVPAAALARQCDVPVVEARGMSDLEGLVVPSLKAAFYVNASSGNGALVRFQHLTHIYLGHGDSDKPPSYNPTHAMYDQVFAAGPAATRRYAAHGVRIPADKFRIVGRPQVEDVHPAQRAITGVTDPVVLYAPTWRGHVEETLLYSLPRGEAIVAALLERGATVIFRPHPFSYDFPDDAATVRRIRDLLAADARRTGRDHLFGPAAESERGILDCINASDAMVSDVSGVVSDYLFSGKPFAMIAVPSEPDSFVAEFPVAAASYVVRGDLADLAPRLSAMLGEDPLLEQRLALRSDYLGDFPPEHYADGFVEAVRHVSQARRPDAERDDRTDLETEEQPGEGGDAGDLHETGAAGPAPEADEPGAADLASTSGLRRYRALLLQVGLDLGATAVALLVLASALLGAPGWVPAVLALVALAGVWLSVPQPDRWSATGDGLLGAGEVTRAVLVAALAVAATRPHGLPLLLAVGLALLAVSLVGEHRIRSAWGRFGLEAANLPAAVRPVAHPVPRAVLPLAVSAVTLLGFVLSWLGLPSLVLFVLAVLVAVVFLHLLERAFRRAAAVLAGEERLRDALVAHAPAFAVYFASTMGAAYQLGMWLPYFERIGRPYVVVTRTVPMLRQIAELCAERGLAVPVVHRPTLRSLEDVIVPSMTTAFYVNNAVRNTHFIERRELTHVWLNHGDSEKPACYNPVHAIYDLIFAAGRAGVDRYARHGVEIPAEKFRIVGRPQVEQIEPARGPVVDQQPPTVLYAPTWQGPYADSRVYSLPIGSAIVQALLDRGARVVFRAHPFNYRYPEAEALVAGIGAVLEGDRARTGRQHLWGDAAEQQLSVEDCFNLSDAMVSDVSAVVSDYLHSGKPFAMVSVGRTPEQLLVEAPAARAAYVLREDLSNLADVLDDLLVADPLGATRDRTRVYYLGDFAHERYADGFLDAARTVISAG